jgi:hypothetical protein
VNESLTDLDLALESIRLGDPAGYEVLLRLIRDALMFERRGSLSP